MTRRSLAAGHESWPIAGGFAISRGRKTSADVLVVEIRDGAHVGRGECVPYARYGESIASVLAAIDGARPAIEAGATRSELALLTSGAARSALDLALCELEASRGGCTVGELFGLEAPRPFESAITISVDRPDAMGDAARVLADRGTLKVKLAGDGLDLDRVRAVRDAAPRARLWIDANEGWDLATYDALAPQLASFGVALLEQPLPAEQDALLRGRPRPVPLCADESAHGAESLAALVDRYDAVSVKLDKAGGLTGALAAVRAARDAKLDVVLGCMVCTSLAIAPACLLVPLCDWIDLDGSILLARDRECGARLEGGLVVPPTLWGGIHET